VDPIEPKKRTPPQVRIRKATENDIPFIFSSWLKSYRDSVFASNITTTIYYNEHHKVIERLLKSCQVYVACNDLQVDELYGFICAEEVEGILVIHFTYVKQIYRNLGVGSSLLNVFNHSADVATLYTHATKMSVKLINKYRLVYSPYIALIPAYRKELESMLNLGKAVPNERK
jgi:GNAT superfamily N-acetyltransferase